MFNKVLSQKLKLLTGSFLVISILSGIFGASSSVFAEAKQSTLTLSASTDSLTVELTPGAAGTFGKSNAATISVTTDNFSGYTLGVFTDGNTDLVGDTGGTIQSISSAVTEQAFSTNSDYNNKWGYRPSKILSNQTVVDNTNFLPVPGTAGNTIDITSSANSSARTYTLDFGARANYDTIPGTYTNSLTIVALANSITYNINYDKNTTDTVNDMPSPNPQVVTIDGGTPVAGSVASLSDALPTRNGYNFEGWCDVATTVDPTTGDQVCSGNTYVAGADYGIDQTEDGSNITLYATWSIKTFDLIITGDSNVSAISVKAGSTSGTSINCTKSDTTFTCANLTYGINYYLYPAFATNYEFSSWTKTDSATNSSLSSTDTENAYYTIGDGNGALTLASRASITMQSFGTTGKFGCDDMSVGDTIMLMDERDSENYLVGKLADGNCWMLDNLALDPTTVSLESLLGKTNADDNALISYKSSVSDSWSTSGARIDSSNKNTVVDGFGAGSHKIGVYYNYCAATAGTLCSNIDGNDHILNAEYDICPAGWRLPITSSSNEYQSLYNSYSNNTASFRNAFSTTLSGFKTDSSYVGINSIGAYPGTGLHAWQFTAGSGMDAHTVNAREVIGYRDYSDALLFNGFDDGDSDPDKDQSSYSYYNGYSMRCMKEHSINVSFNYDSGISSIQIKRSDHSVYDTVDVSGGTVSLITGKAYQISPVSNSGYMPSTMTVLSGDASINNSELIANTTNSAISISSETASNKNVSFYGLYAKSLTINGYTIDEDGEGVDLTGGGTYHVSIDSGNYDINSIEITSGTFYAINNFVPGKNASFDLVVGNNAGKITLISSSSVCITADALVTLANGTKVPVKDLQGDEELLVWDFETGNYGTAPIVFIDSDPEKDYDIIHAVFSDGTETEIVYEHGFYDYTLNKFVYINNNNPEQYIGHQFVKQADDSYTTVELVNITHETRNTTVYSPVTFGHLNYFTDELLSMPGGIPGMFNYFDVDKNTMSYDQEKKQADIAQYGLLTYEELTDHIGNLISELGFEAYNGQYLKVSIGKGLITWDDIKALAERYGHFTNN